MAQLSTKSNKLNHNIYTDRYQKHTSQTLKIQGGQMEKDIIQGTDNFTVVSSKQRKNIPPLIANPGSHGDLYKQQNGNQNSQAVSKQKQQNQPERKQRRQSQPIGFYPGNTYYYPYYYDSSGCYYCYCCNGHCCPCHICHSHHNCSVICCDPFPCCNGCTGFHCGCFNCVGPCQDCDCVKNNNCEGCDCLPCCSGCYFCSNSCDGACINSLPCCNGCECLQICKILPCCNGCQCQPLCGCLPCCNQNVCNVCGCLQDCSVFNCFNGSNGDCNCCGNYTISCNQKSASTRKNESNLIYNTIQNITCLDSAKICLPQKGKAHSDYNRHLSMLRLNLSFWLRRLSIWRRNLLQYSYLFYIQFSHFCFQNKDYQFFLQIIKINFLKQVISYKT